MNNLLLMYLIIIKDATPLYVNPLEEKLDSLLDVHSELKTEI